jgi:hypothetical protein
MVVKKKQPEAAEFLCGEVWFEIKNTVIYDLNKAKTNKSAIRIFYDEIR